MVQEVEALQAGWGYCSTAPGTCPTRRRSADLPTRGGEDTSGARPFLPSPRCGSGGARRREVAARAAVLHPSPASTRLPIGRLRSAPSPATGRGEEMTFASLNFAIRWPPWAENSQPVGLKSGSCAAARAPLRAALSMSIDLKTDYIEGRFESVKYVAKECHLDQEPNPLRALVVSQQLGQIELPELRVQPMLPKTLAEWNLEKVRDPPTSALILPSRRVTFTSRQEIVPCALCSTASITDHGKVRVGHQVAMPDSR